MKQEKVQFTNNVQLVDGCILKKAACGAVQVKLMQAAHVLSVQRCSFYVPKVLDYDEKTQTMKLEYLRDLMSLKQYFRNRRQIAEMLYSIGDALAWCHGNLNISEEDRVAALGCWQGQADDQVVVHGDFNMTNLCYSPSMNRLVILDWETSPALGFQCNWASRYLDIVQFVRNLLLQQESLGLGFLLFRRRVKVFLTAYQQISGMTLDMKQLGRLLYEYNKAVMKKQWTQGKYLSGLHSILGSWVFSVNLNSMNIHKLAQLKTCHGTSLQRTGAIYD